MATTTSPLPNQVTLETLATLAPGLPTQFAPTRDALYVIQSGAEPVSGLLEIENGKVVPTGLTPDAIAKSLSLPQARGQITAISADDDGRIAFCFAGLDGQKPFAAVGTFDPATGEIFTPVDQFSLEPVAPSFITSTARPFLHVRGEVSSVVRVEGSEIHLLTIRNLRSLQPQLAEKTVELGTLKDAVVRSAWEWSPASEAGVFYLTDTASRWIRTVDSEGKIGHVARFDESINSISPAALDAAGRVLVLAADRDGICSTLLIQNKDAFKAIAASSFVLKGHDPSSLRMDRLVAIPGKPNQFATYESTTGRVLNVKLD